MQSVEELELPQLPSQDPELRGPRFHELTDRLAAQGWLARTELGYAVLDRESAAFFLRTRSATFPGLKIAELFGIDDGPLAEEIRRNILHIDGDDHRRLRNLVNPAFTPRAADRWRPEMRRLLAGLWERVGPSGRCELVADFAKAYPSLVIATVMGAPLGDAERLHHWSNWIQRQFDGPALIEQRAEIERAVEEFYAYAGKLLEERRRAPADDLISTLIAARDGGDRLDDAELVNLVLNVLIGAVDTTQSQLAQAMRLFAEHPDQWEALRGDPELAAPAVEEVLRYEPITPFTARILLEDVEHRGVRFPEGTLLMVSAVTANREGQAPGFDITADRDGERPLTFGAGVHYCLGANLARAELEEGLRFLAPRMPGLELDGDPEYGTVQGIYGLDRLPLRWRGLPDPALR
jgi:cytochrome P450